MPKGVYKHTHLIGNKNGFKKGGVPWNKGNDKVKIIICKFCGENKETRDFRNNKGIYCSKSCKTKDNIGIYKTNIYREKQRIKALNQFKNGMPEETKRKLRENQIKFIEMFYGLQPNSLCPQIGKFEKPILDYLESLWNYKILRQYKVYGYFIDGYCPALNLSIEIDEPYHNKKPNKHLQRELNIKSILGSNILRLEVKK